VGRQATASAGAVDPEDAGVASALVNTMQQVGGSIGVALLSTFSATAATSFVTSHGGATASTVAAGAVHGYTMAFWWRVIRQSHTIRSNGRLQRQPAQGPPVMRRVVVKARAGTVKTARRVLVALLGVGAAVMLAPGPARGSTSGHVWCDQFHVAYAINTSCAVEQHVSRLYVTRCIPRSYQLPGRLPPCRKSLSGFRCTPTGDIYAVVKCVVGRRRVGLHLAE
jgi:hypothetical protein